MKDRTLWGIRMGVGLLFVAVAIVIFLKVPNHKTLSPITVRLAWLHQAQFTGLYVAKEKGFYEEVGLDVELKEFDYASDQGEELTSGKVDFSVASAQELISFIDRGDALKAVAVIYQVAPYAFASLKDKNIITPADFKGKKLGLAGASQQSLVTYRALMNRYGVSEKDVTFKELGFDTPQDIKTDQADVVDLYRTDQTFYLDKLGVAYNLLLPEQFNFDVYGDVLIAKETMMRDNPDQVRKFVQATLKGWTYALENKEEALTIVDKYANEQYKDPEYERYILEQSMPLILPLGKQQVGSMQYLKWKKALEAMESGGVIKSQLKVEDIYTTKFLRNEPV